MTVALAEIDGLTRHRNLLADEVVDLEDTTRGGSPEFNSSMRKIEHYGSVEKLETVEKLCP